MPDVVGTGANAAQLRRDSGIFEIASRAKCKHCGGASIGQFCCDGCLAVSGLLEAEGLGRYYALGGGQGVAITTWGKTSDHKWLEQLEASRPFEGGLRAISLDVQGVHCAACVWLFEELFRRQPAGVAVLVNPAIGRMDLSVGPEFDLPRYVDAVERFGYRVGPSRKGTLRSGESSDLLLRTGVCVAIAMNAMIFAIAIYAGLRSGPIFAFFHGLNFALATLSVLVGGTVFFRSAWQAFRQRVLHLDVPIALGIALAYAGSAYSLLARGGGAAYFDTVTVFIALMLVGRLLQERVLERNRRQLLASDGVDSLLTRVLGDDGSVTLGPCIGVRAGQRLLVAPSDLVPVPAILESDGASISLDWINGESSPRETTRGDPIPAGAFNVGREAVIVRASSAFDTSPIVALLRTPREKPADMARATPWWRLFTRVYVLVVLSLSAVAFAAWMIGTRDLARSLEVTTAVLVITCPCAFGIATPMAYELVQAGLRRAGVFVRSASFLDRAVDVRRVVFDKTGTLTTGTLAVSNHEALAALGAEEQRVLYNLAARSTHPKSVAIARALTDRNTARLVPDLPIVERAGFGLELRLGGRTYRLGSHDFAGVGGGEDEGAGVWFTLEQALDRRVLAVIELSEALRLDAAEETKALEATGYDVWILSGDTQARVDQLADAAGVPRERAIGAVSPHAKADWIAAHDHHDTLMVGDGINDTLATERAFASATPAIDRPFLPARTDLYFTSSGLRPVRLALESAHALRRVTRRNLAVAVAYNVITVSLAYAGLMTPLLCAVIMPASSLSIVLATIASLSPRSPLWRS